jgi:hypothetical protein
MDAPVQINDLTAATAKSAGSKRLPTLWFGFVLAAMLLVVELGEGALNHTENSTLLFSFLWLCGITYWLFCVYRIHLITKETSRSDYPISPLKAVGFHLIPFFNLYWIFRWPNELARFVNRRLAKPAAAIGWPGFFLLVGFFLKEFDGSLGLFVLFAVLVYFDRKLALAVPSSADTWDAGC